MSKKQKILFVTPTFPPAINGLANVVYAYADYIFRNGYEVEIFTPGPSSYVFNGLSVKCLPIFGSFSLRGLPRGSIGEYIKFLKNSDADILVCHAFQTVATDFSLKYFNGYKIYHSHGVSWRSGISDNVVMSVVRRLSYLPYEILGPTLLKMADAGIFLGKGTNSDRVFDAKYFHKKTTQIIRNASFFDKAEIKIFNNKNKLKLLIVGSCSVEKGFVRLLDLISILNPESVSEIVICTTRNSPFLPQFLKKLTEFNLIKVSLVYDKTGMELGEFYNNADIFLNLSISECYPLVMADAANFRIPMMCFDTGYQNEIDGAKIFSSIYCMAEFINKFKENIEDLNRLSEATYPKTWDESGAEFKNFLLKLNIQGL